MTKTANEIQAVLIEGYSLEEAKQELINRINEYFFETEN